MLNKPIYFDYASTTPCDPRVFEKMSKFFVEDFGNPNSSHFYGQVAKKAVETARINIQKLLNIKFENEIIFTSGASESIKLIFEKLSQSQYLLNRTDFITFSTEHKIVLDTVSGFSKDRIKILNVKGDGLIDLEELESSLSKKTAMVSVCFVNNETGVIQKLESIVNICHKVGVLVHVDATQAVGKISIDVQKLDIDFLSASGHKFYGPKGIGILYYKSEHLKHLRNKYYNKDIEFGIRPGTLPVSLCVGIGEAAKIAEAELEINFNKISKLREIFVEEINANLNEIYINGSQNSNYPGIINISFRGCEGESLMMEAKRIAVSSGSACTSNKLTISHVLNAMKVKADIAQSSIRFSIGKFTREEEIFIATKDLINATNKLRAISAIWEMIQDNIDIDQIFKSR